MKASIRGLQTAVNLGAAGALLWFATPLLAFGTWHPFDDMRARVALLALVALLLLGWRGLQLLLARRRNERLLSSLESNDATPRTEPAFPEGARDAAAGHRGARRQTTLVAAPAASVTVAVVRLHRRAGRGQDHRAAAFGAQVSARRAHRARPGGGHRRHAAVRLVVQPGRRLHRHRRTLHHAGQRRLRRRGGMAAVHGAAAPVSAGAADQRRDRQRQRARPAARRRRAGAAGRRGRARLHELRRSSISAFRSTCW